jgi:hypothetical protein
VTRRWLAAGVLAVVLAVAGLIGWRAYDARRAASPVVAAQDFDPSPRDKGDDAAIETVAGADDAAPTGGTPMAQRVAIVRLLNKRNGVARDLTLKPGQAVRVGDAIVRLRACERTAPWEQDTLTGAFVQLDVRGSDTHWRRVFSGWLYKERPALNAVQHPVYDVWAKSCTMEWPATGPDTVTAGAGAGGGASRSSAAKSPAAPEDAADGETQAPPSSAAASNAQ